MTANAIIYLFFFLLVILILLFFLIEVKKMFQHYATKIKAGKDLMESNRAKSDLELISSFINSSSVWIKPMTDESGLSDITITSLVGLAKRHRILLRPIIKFLEKSLKEKPDNETSRNLADLKLMLNKDVKS